MKTIATLSGDVLSLISEYISPQDLFVLWLTGSKPIQGLLGPYGNIRSIELELMQFATVRPPFSFFGHFTQLTTFKLSSGIPFRAFVRANNRTTDITTLPKTLTSLSLMAPNALEMLYNREILDVDTSKVNTSAYQRYKRGELEVIEEYKLREPSTKSRLFYNLNEVFPNLRSLEIRELPITTTQEDEECMFGAKARWKTDSGLAYTEYPFNGDAIPFPSTCPPKFETLPEALNQASDWLQVQLLQSLPKSLTKLTALLAQPWECATISDYLPSNVTDLYIRTLTNPLREDAEAWYGFFCCFIFFDPSPYLY